VDTALSGLAWFALGNGFAFGEDCAGFIGVGPFWNVKEVAGFQQWLFCATATTIVSGSVAERCSFLTYCTYSVVIAAFVYPVVAHWVWAGGWLSQLEDTIGLPKFYDFAGTAVVHVVGGTAGLVGAIALGPRFRRFKRAHAFSTLPVLKCLKYRRHVISSTYPGSSDTIATLGITILWYGWYGFNCGSVKQQPGESLEEMNTRIGLVAINTSLGPIGAVVAGLVGFPLLGTEFNLTHLCNCILAGLVSITGLASTTEEVYCLLAGAIGSFVYLAARNTLLFCGIDDPVGASPIHLGVGSWGTLAVGIFSQQGLVAGEGWGQLASQSLGLLAVLAWSTSLSVLAFGSIKLLFSQFLRRSREQELKGLIPEAKLMQQVYKQQFLAKQQEEGLAKKLRSWQNKRQLRFRTSPGKSARGVEWTDSSSSRNKQFDPLKMFDDYSAGVAEAVADQSEAANARKSGKTGEAQAQEVGADNQATEKVQAGAARPGTEQEGGGEEEVKEEKEKSTEQKQELLAEEENQKVSEEEEPRKQEEEEEQEEGQTAKEKEVAEAESAQLLQVESWLCGAGFKQMVPVFAAHGFTSMEAVELITIDDLLAMDLKRGQARLLYKQLQLHLLRREQQRQQARELALTHTHNSFALADDRLEISGAGRGRGETGNGALELLRTPSMQRLRALDSLAEGVRDPTKQSKSASNSANPSSDMELIYINSSPHASPKLGTVLGPHASPKLGTVLGPHASSKLGMGLGGPMLGLSAPSIAHVLGSSSVKGSPAKQYASLLGSPAKQLRRHSLMHLDSHMSPAQRIKRALANGLARRSSTVAAPGQRARSRSRGDERSKGSIDEDVLPATQGGLAGGVHRRVKLYTSGYKPGDGLRVQVASDLHIEMWDRQVYYPKEYLMETVVSPQEKVLALLGDIGVVGTDSGFSDYVDFLSFQCSRFEFVLLLAGNHEFYCSTGGGGSDNPICTEQIKQRIRKFADSIPNLYFLDRDTVLINDVCVVGVTLWSFIPKDEQFMVEGGVNDYELIYVNDKEEGLRKLTAKDTNRWHEADLTYLTAEASWAKKQDLNVLVLGHHAPSFESTSDPEHEHSPISSAFCSSLDYLFDYGGQSETSHIHTWAFGHTHWPSDQYIGGVHIVSNQYGYAAAGNDFDPEFSVCVPHRPV